MGSLLWSLFSAIETNVFRGWGMNPGLLVFVYFPITLPLSYNGSPLMRAFSL
jgi:hypothetical protein